MLIHLLKVFFFPLALKAFFFPLTLKALFFPLALVAAPIYAAEFPAPAGVDWRDFRGGVYVSGDIYLAGQPLSPQAMQRVSAAGITTIVNMRTPGEMANKKSTPIDEPALSRKLNIEYHHLPSGGTDYPFSPESVSAFADILANTDGKVLLHCNSGRRAAHLWVAYLVNHQQVDMATAIRLGQAANFGSIPLEGYLAKPLSYQLIAPSH